MLEQQHIPPFQPNHILSFITDINKTFHIYILLDVMQKITQDELLKTYEKYSRMKIKIREANKRYANTEKGKRTKSNIRREYIEKKRTTLTIVLT